MSCPEALIECEKCNLKIKRCDKETHNCIDDLKSQLKLKDKMIKARDEIIEKLMKEFNQISNGLPTYIQDMIENCKIEIPSMVERTSVREKPGYKIYEHHKQKYH